MIAILRIVSVSRMVTIHSTIATIRIVTNARKVTFPSTLLRIVSVPRLVTTKTVIIPWTGIISRMVSISRKLKSLGLSTSPGCGKLLSFLGQSQSQGRLSIYQYFRCSNLHYTKDDHHSLEQLLFLVQPASLGWSQSRGLLQFLKWSSG